MAGAATLCRHGLQPPPPNQVPLSFEHGRSDGGSRSGRAAAPVAAAAVNARVPAASAAGQRPRQPSKVAGFTQVDGLPSAAATVAAAVATAAAATAAAAAASAKATTTATLNCSCGSQCRGRRRRRCGEPGPPWRATTGPLVRFQWSRRSRSSITGHVPVRPRAERADRPPRR